ncbi:unnamed protein product, partial [marine sediment metagenome]
MKRVYLAGPDVFYPDAKERAESLKKLCAAKGLEGVFPLDADLDLDAIREPGDKGVAIFKANLELITSCDAVLANMTPFRGPSMDVGTAYEMGVARGQGKPVVSYTSDRRLYERRVEDDGLLIERFNMVDNLMVDAGSEAICPTPLAAVAFLAELL